MVNPMNLLVLDSSTGTLFLGLLVNGEPKDYLVETLDRQQSEWMVPRLMSFLKKNQLTMQEVNAFVVGDGPGSFTGVRLGLTLVKTFALLKPMPVYPISSLQLFALAPLSVVWLDARSDRMYVGVYERDHIHVGPMVLSMTEKHTLTNAYPQATWITPAQACLQPQQILNHLAILLPHLQPLGDVHKLNPRYLKDLV
jgi:tRNA threonylcarbamoyl adenosine modification protein YeaZ